MTDEPQHIKEIRERLEAAQDIIAIFPGILASHVILLLEEREVLREALLKIKTNMDTWHNLNGLKTDDYPKPKQLDHILVEAALNWKPA